MEKAKTKFTSASMLDSMLAASAAPAQAKEAPAAKPSERRPKPARKQPSGQPTKRPGIATTVEIAPDVYMAMTIRKAKSARGGDRSFVKILDAALRAYLADELKACEAIGS